VGTVSNNSSGINGHPGVLTIKADRPSIAGQAHRSSRPDQSKGAWSSIAREASRLIAPISP
jgi:hypothetical protein